MHKLFHHGRHSHHNKPLPEPLVDPDEGKTPIGELVIVPIQGRDLPNRERFGKQDAFILFKLGNVSKRCSTDIRGGQRPRWTNDQVHILMYESDAKDAKSLYVSCLDEDEKKNDLIGDCVINLDKVLEKGEHDDWFDLTWKGREAGGLMLQLTYFSNDPSHPTSKVHRFYKNPGPSTGAPLRRPIHPTANSPNHNVTTAAAQPTQNTDTGAVYKPPVVAEQAHTPSPPKTSGYLGDNTGIPPHGGRVSPAPGGGRISPVPGGGRISPVPPLNGGRISPIPGQNQFIGQPSAANPYPPINNFTGYPTPQMPYPPAGYPNPNAGGYPSNPYQQNQGYPPQFNTINGYPPQFNNNNNNNQFNQGYPPQNFNNTINGYPPQPQFNNNNNNSGYPPINNGPGLYPPQQGMNRPASPAGGGGYPPSGYPFAASNIYPPNNPGGGYPPQQQQQQQQQPQQQQQSRPVPQPPTDSHESGLNTLPESLPGSFPTKAKNNKNTSNNSNNNSNNGGLGGHKQSLNSGQPASSNMGRSSSPMIPGGYPQSRSPSPPTLPPRNNNNNNNNSYNNNQYHSQAPQAIVQPGYGNGRY